jgi:uncharacterized membrane protein YdjX (TVP38/TMEM64 family)
MSRPVATSRSGRPSVWKRWALALGLLGAIATFYGLGLHDRFSWAGVRASLADWQRVVDDNWVGSIFLFFVVYVAVTALSLPVATFLTLAGGALFGRWLGTAVVSLASTLGAVLAFLSSRTILRDWVERGLAGRMQPIQQGLERDGAYYLLTLRLVPLFPFWLVNLGMGLTRMPVATFAVVSLIGMLPATFLYVLAGEALATIDSPRDLLSTQVVVALTLLGVVPLAIRWAIAR